MESHLDIAEHQQDDHHNRIVGFAFLAETSMRRIPLSACCRLDDRHNSSKNS